MACPNAVASLVSDMKMIVAYETAANWREATAMDSAFNALSWDDQCVQAALPEYLASAGAERAKVDDAFNAMIPKPAESIDPKQAMMQTWLKARLFSYNKAFPFD
uniref:ATPTG10-like domain-containing protein n=1 Tax=Karlodinium veneficum TaxID=407301 RepID=A7YXY8_KARVE|nr:conserved hypothetical protein [Karlodinium veneficum]|mmetsp:Transcript_86394/g.135177  ORF Transcript_86394/g.135177 Transcript_86394/m.135177 type:complete len:105 (-) Transcript_86394:73-387(-)